MLICVYIRKYQYPKTLKSPEDRNMIFIKLIKNASYYTNSWFFIKFYRCDIYIK